jgi:hypothetical protein
VNGFFKAIPVGDFLSDQLKLPVRSISGFYHPYRTQTKKWFNEFFSLIVFLGIMAVFTWLQIELDLVLDGFLQTFTIIVTICIELAAIWVWFKFAYEKS